MPFQYLKLFENYHFLVLNPSIFFFFFLPLQTLNADLTSSKWGFLNIFSYGKNIQTPLWFPIRKLNLMSFERNT